MRRALGLAAHVAGQTGDNPAVGCVIVKSGVVLGEGATQAGGRPHAEEVALRDVEAAGATAYVTLEPCARRSAGGTSCADLMVQANVLRVVIAARDPHPNAAGAGIQRMEETGIVVEVGVLGDEARALNADFLAKWENR
jgi:diaminohydroxyphosphoribosylaminopyrimidine deaminase/5-amino-6-(5-phosphoribosylamino)uracil reductase